MNAYPLSLLLIVVIVFFFAGVLDAPFPRLAARSLASVFIEGFIILVVVEFSLVVEQVLDVAAHLGGSACSNSLFRTMYVRGMSANREMLQGKTVGS